MKKVTFDLNFERVAGSLTSPFSAHQPLENILKRENNNKSFHLQPLSFHIPFQGVG